MLYVDSIVIHNIKSFKHATIKFGHGFNCIAGPNGSGKSSICDSLLFALGESSLKRMRVSNSVSLINDSAKPKPEDGLTKAYVKINFKGDQDIEVYKSIKSNGGITYRLNGKRITRQEMLEVLIASNCEINDTNTIMQKEVGTLVGLTPKERRELIDVAAGIKEYNDKKNNSLKELEKVEQKINEAQIQLSERAGFLNELEKEKKDAEKYIELTNAIKGLAFSILKSREAELTTDYERSSERLKANNDAKVKLDIELKKIDVETEALSAERQKLSTKLNAGSIEMGSTNKMIEEASREVAVKNTQLASMAEHHKDLEAKNAGLKVDTEKITEDTKAGKAELDSLARELEKRLAIVGSTDLEGMGEESEMLARYGENQKIIDELEIQLIRLSELYNSRIYERSSLEKDVSNFRIDYDSSSTELNGIETSVTAAHAKVAELKAEMEKRTKAMDLKAKEISVLNAQNDKIYSETIDLREQMAMLGRESDKSTAVLKRGIESGFFGRAYELCSYDDKYAVAIQAAAGGRFNYFVVDSAETANSAIKILKQKSLGRASFIPLGEIIVRASQEEKRLTPLIKQVRYDKQFSKAFDFIFSNTYIVDGIEHAKKIGIGKYRYVTLEGELVEPSGIISGGSIRVVQSPAMIESKMKRVEEEKAKVAATLGKLNGEMESIRKEIGTMQTEEINQSIELKHLLLDKESLVSKSKATSKTIAVMEQSIKEASKGADEAFAKRSPIGEKISTLRAENKGIYDATNPKDGKKKRHISKEELAAIKQAREESEQMKIRIATLQNSSELWDKRHTEIKEEMARNTAEAKQLKAKISETQKEIDEGSARLKELQEKIKGHDSKSATIYKELQQFESKITALTTEKGKFSANLERARYEAIEIESKKSQTQTRLNDIKAELLSYKDVPKMAEMAMDKMELQLGIAKNDLERLGAVNLKAPEIYDSKKGDVESAKEKVQVLENEKVSVISMITEIDSKKLNIFNQTYTEVNDNFKKLYASISDGSAYLYLQEPKDPFNSGLMINITSAAKKKMTPEQMSGGEQALLMLMLLFAIQTRNKMAFYVFDEIDSSLDKLNAKKLSLLIKELAKQSQMIVVSHKDTMLLHADNVIGVAKKDNESQVVGLNVTAQEVTNS
ncbi:MAG TPA: chromosome segregation SMC family protein [Candidatus Baltobacteraceae bacterium]|nr:chromosome segregation SMC family protein [Candidatus Baltobacteraceae bacterium]